MRNFTAIAVTICGATCLSLLPMPGWAEWARPAWVLLVLIYWTMTMPYINLGMAWVSGLLLDVLTGTMLGEHALAFTIVIYLVYRSRMRVNMHPMLQQGLSILIFVLVYQFIIFSIQGFVGELPHSYLYWLSSLTSMLLWPWLFVLMRDYGKWVRIALTE
jgi:rod shape-determining protein MreD